MVKLPLTKGGFFRSEFMRKIIARERRKNAGVR
jgi:hypothetical protein